MILSLIEIEQNPVFAMCRPYNMKWIKFLRLNFRYLNKHELAMVLEILWILCATVILELKFAVIYCHTAIFGGKLHSNINHICPETLRLAANGLVMLLNGSYNCDGNINRVLKARVRYIDESFDYLKINHLYDLTFLLDLCLNCRCY